MEGQVIENAVQETVQETVDKVNSNWDQIKAYFNGHIPDLISFGMKVVLSIVAFYVGTKLIKWLSEGCEAFHGKGRHRHGGCPVHLFFWEIFAVSDSDF